MCLFLARFNTYFGPMGCKYMGCMLCEYFGHFLLCHNVNLKIFEGSSTPERTELLTTFLNNFALFAYK